MFNAKYDVAIIRDFKMWSIKNVLKSCRYPKARAKGNNISLLQVLNEIL
jgi:hypothetical protein